MKHNRTTKSDSTRSIVWGGLLLGVIALPLAAGEVEELYKKWVRPKNMNIGPQQARFERLQGEDPKHGVTEVGLERTVCYGECPVYSVTLKPDGSVRYVGTEHVTRRGTHVGEINPEDFHQLAEYLVESGYDSLETEYPLPVSDLPSTYTTAVINGKRKVIHHYGGYGPVKLWVLEQAIDAVVARARWNDPNTKPTTPDKRP